jgi:hypothetical protein
MKKIAVFMFVVSIVLSGCTGVRFVGFQREDRIINVPKTFFDRTITYNVDTDAKRYMSNLESLLGQSKHLQAPYADDLILPLYRDTDIDRNRRITVVEARAFYDDCVLRFEDSLGPVQFQ